VHILVLTVLQQRITQRCGLQKVKMKQQVPNNSIGYLKKAAVLATAKESKPKTGFLKAFEEIQVTACLHVNKVLLNSRQRYIAAKTLRPFLNINILHFKVEVLLNSVQIFVHNSLVYEKFRNSGVPLKQTC
jgi:hypothetical protein